MGKLALFTRYGGEIRDFLNEATRESVKDALLLHTVSASAYLQAYADEYGVDLLHINPLAENYNRWGSYFHASRMAQNRLKKRESYKHLSHARNQRQFIDYLKGNPLTYHVLNTLHRLSYRYYLNRETAGMLSRAGITELWMSNYSSPSKLAMAITAKSAGCKVVCYIHSWKDFYINNYVPPTIDELRVWSHNMKAQFLAANPHLADNQIVVTGNPRITALHQHHVIHDYAYYAKKYGINTGRFILYTAINPIVYENEPQLVKLIHDQLNMELGDDAPCILIKPNPMDSAPERWNEIANIHNVGIMQSGWEWNNIEDFNLPSIDAELEWFDLLNHCTCTMNVASTVTIESLACGKPVINICFDIDSKPSEIFERFTNSPFYRSLLERIDIMVANELSQLVNGYLSVTNKVAGKNLDDIVLI